MIVGQSRSDIPTQRDFLLSWMMSQPNKRFEPGELAELVKAEFLRLYGRPFKDVGKASRELAMLGRIQRTAKGREQRYWYDPDFDSGDELFGQQSNHHSDDAVWNQFLFKGSEVNRANWESLRSKIEKELSVKQARVLVDKISKLLSQSNLKPPS
jgi:hypothetical protein